jgi:hypothetical protein
MSTKTNDRVATVHSMTQGISAIIKHHLLSATRTCINCSEFDEKSEICRIHKARPPARIIALGCGDHVDMIPF